MGGEQRSVVVRLSMDTAQAIRASKEFGTEFGRAMQDAERRSTRTSAAVDDIGHKAGRMALATTGALAAMGKAAIDWESQFAGVAKTVDATGSQLNALEGDLRGLARSMPATHQEIAATAEAAGQLGVATGDITDFTKIMVEMGETTNLSADAAATSIAQFMNVMETVPDAVDNIGNTIVDLGNKGASTEAQIVDMAQRLAGAGQLVGASEADVLGLASAMANLGIQSELGGGAVQRVFTIIYSAVKDGGDQLTGFADLAGMSAEAFARSWQTDPVAAFDALLQGMGGVQAEGGNLIERLADLGIKGTQNLQVILRLAGAGDMLTESLKTSNQAWDQNSALAEEYGKRLGTTGAQVQVAWNRIKDSGIEAGASLLPEVARLVDGAGDLADAFGALPDPVHSSIVTLLELTALTGGATWLGAKAIGGVRGLTEAMETLTGEAFSTKHALGEVAVAAAAIGLATGALASVGNQIDDMQRSRAATDAAVSSYEDLADALQYSNVGKYAGDLGINLQRLASDLNDNGESGEYVTRVMDQLAASSHGLGAMLQSSYGHTLGIIPGLPDLNDADKAYAAREDLRSLLRNYAEGQDRQDSLTHLLVDPLNDVPAAAGSAADASEGLAGATDALGDSAGGAAIDIEKLRRSMERQRQAALGAFDAETQYRQALKDAQEQARSNEAGIRGNSDAALENRAALSSLAAAWNGQSKAVKNNEQRFREAKDAFIDTAIAMHVPEDRARALAAAVLDIPRSRVIQIDANTGQAMSAMDQVAARLREMDGRTATTYVRTVYQHQNKLPDVPMPGQENAMGGFYPRVAAYAGGGIDRANAHVPEITRGGPIRIWSEPETGGEAYIPLANDGRRPRARAVLSATAYAMGGEVTWRRGSYTPSSGAAGGRGGALRVTGRLDTPFGPADIEGIATEVARSEIAAEKRFDRVMHGR